MKEIMAATLVFLAGAWAQSIVTMPPAPGPGYIAVEQGGTMAWKQQDQMTVPKVTHTKVKHEIVDEVTTRECPAGYEGHYVDQYVGFDSHLESGGTIWGSNNNVIINGGTEGGPAYALCFKKDFMDSVRKNPDLDTHRPAPPRAVEYTIPAIPNYVPTPYYPTWETCTLPTTGGVCTPHSIGDFLESYR